MGSKDRELSHRLTAVLAQLVAKFSFELWSFKSFRELINFDKLSQTEQDRIFNELEVTTLGFLILQGNLLGFKKEYEQLLAEDFLKIYIDLGIEKQFVDMWEELIKTRLQEYKEDLEEMFAVSEKEDKGTGDYKQVLVATLVLDGVNHIREGKVKEGDMLVKYMSDALTMLSVSLEELFKSPEAKALLKDKSH